jgi:hypothetical protein
MLEVGVEFEAVESRNRKTSWFYGSIITLWSNLRHPDLYFGKAKGSRRHFVREVVKNVWKPQGRSKRLQRMDSPKDLL